MAEKENQMDDILKEAIADAKTVRDTALANAKIALEEAFAPRLQSMLSQKIAQEVNEDSDEEVDNIVNNSSEITDENPEPEMTAEPKGNEPPAATAGIKPETPAETGDTTDAGDGNEDVDIKALFADLEIPTDENPEGSSEETPEITNDKPVEEPVASATEGIDADEELDLDEIISELEEDDGYKYQYEEDAELNEDADEDIDITLDEDEEIEEQ
jgi:hypothetical protein